MTAHRFSCDLELWPHGQLVSICHALSRMSKPLFDVVCCKDLPRKEAPSHVFSEWLTQAYRRRSTAARRTTNRSHPSFQVELHC